MRNRCFIVFCVILVATTGCPPAEDPQTGQDTVLGLGDGCSPVSFSGSHFVGTIRIDPDFGPAMARLNGYAKKNNVKIDVTSSYRESNSNLHDAVVAPANRSNHLVGHAIDFNLLYGDGFSQRCNSGCLAGSFSSLPTGVRGFLQDVRNDSVLKWGGDFSTPDVVHIDDRLNTRNPTEWDARYAAMRGRGADCETTTTGDPDIDVLNLAADVAELTGDINLISEVGADLRAGRRCEALNRIAIALGQPTTSCGGTTQPPATPCPPTGWVACTCPNEHYCYGVYCNGTLYHAEGPKCGEQRCGP